MIGVVKDVISGMIATRRKALFIYFPTGFRRGAQRFGAGADRRRSGGARRRLGAALDQVAPSLSDFINPMDEVQALQIYPFRVTSGWPASSAAWRCC